MKSDERSDLRPSVTGTGGPPGPSGTFPPVPPRERTLVWLILIIGAILQLNAILHRGTMGQDFQHNYGISKVIASDFANALHFNHTNPPLYYFLAALIIRATSGIHDVVLIGLVNLLINSGALWLFYRISLYLIKSPVFRISLLTLVTFLPVRLIHSVVLAGDALTMLPMFSLAFFSICLYLEPRPKRRLFIASGIGLVLTLGVLAKYTFISAIAATSIILLQRMRRGQGSLLETGKLLILALLLPTLVGVLEFYGHARFTHTLGLRREMANDMTFATILSLKKRDLHVLSAPLYHEPLGAAGTGWNQRGNPGPPYELLTNNRYGYLALLHFTTFTDCLNIFQFDPETNYFRGRSQFNQKVMAIAVKTALPITMGCIGVVLVVTAVVFWFGMVAPNRSSPIVETVVLLSVGWFCNIVLALPFVEGAVIAGYWLPRLILPVLLLFFLLMFYGLERALPGRARAIVSYASLAFVVFQSTLHVLFLWPWGEF